MAAEQVRQNLGQVAPSPKDPRQPLLQPWVGLQVKSPELGARMIQRLVNVGQVLPRQAKPRKPLLKRSLRKNLPLMNTKVKSMLDVGQELLAPWAVNWFRSKLNLQWFLVLMLFLEIWSTTDLLIADETEEKVRTITRELAIYLVFMVVLCWGMYIKFAS